MRGNLFIITSPSGGGKGTLIKEILQTVPNIGYSVSYTTRKQREGEIHGKNYFFVSPEEFSDLEKNDEFLEFANVHGNFYGTSKRQVENEISSGRDFILEIDVQGAENIRKTNPESIGVFILPPSFEVLRKRLTDRNTEKQTDLDLRLMNAKTEVLFYSRFDYVIVNDEKARAVEELKSVIYAERLKQDRQKEVVQSIIETFH